MKSTKKLSNLYQRNKSGTLYMRFSYLGYNIHRSTKTSDPNLAKKVIERTKKEIFEQVNGAISEAEDGSIRLSKAIEEVYEERWVGNATGWRSYRLAYRIVEILGDIPISQIDTKKVRIVHTKLRGEIKCEGTVNRYMAAFRTVMRHAADSYNVPYPRFRLGKESSGRLKVYSRKEESEILGWFRSNGLSEMADITAVLIDTGFRLSECLGIGKRNKEGRLISEANVGKKRLTSWTNKGSRPRTIPLTNRASAILAARGRIPFRIEIDEFQRNWRKMRTALHLEKDCVAHACRHTCASRLLETGSSLLVVKDWLGHSTITVTVKYCHLAPSGLEEAAARLEDYR